MIELGLFTISERYFSKNLQLVEQFAGKKRFEWKYFKEGKFTRN